MTVFVRSLTDDVDQIEVIVCPECDAELDPDEAAERRVYECSRCGDQIVPEYGERARCTACHVFAGKVADASCPQCEQPIDDLAALAAVARWQTSDGELHDSAEAAAEWIAAEEQRHLNWLAAQAETRAWLDTWRAEREVRRRALAAAVDVARAHGVPIPWAEDDHEFWLDSRSVYLDGRDWLALVGMTEDEFFGGSRSLSRDALLARLGGLYDASVTAGLDAGERRFFASLMEGLFTESGFGRAQRSYDTEAFIAYVTERWGASS